ncbi:MAG: bifunctional phosphoribosylaminoimidazolecarboxamide formyltransferase/IMP cyclohydrolase [Mucilaginibacter polytrichastri]|nr:bifunctional phosphoribosylaminoimidazolecarboxamide formyltransferase/IMP cyclohydrolase [Mucilaginibacter polytrichastri]
MNKPVRIKNALISVYYKDQLEPLIRELNRLGVALYSTGGTETFIRDLGIGVNRVEDLTSYPSILGGRVKTLHPKVFGGILGRRELDSDKAQMNEYEIPEIDLVIVDLYPFEETLASGASEQDIIEKIDIGGISLIRAAAKNHADVVIIASKNDYNALTEILANQDGETSLEQRRQFAAKAFNVTSHYDTAIFNWFNTGQENDVLKLSESSSKVLRYGENPHQKGVFYGDLDALFEQLNGKELSYNNLVDIDAAVALIDEFDEPTFAILKHTNACGIASRDTLSDAWDAALAADPVSAFGGVLICNREVDAETAAKINTLFFEVLVAPDFDTDALAILKGKKNRILLLRKPVSLPKKLVKTLLNGFIEQDKDAVIEGPEQMTTVTQKSPGATELDDLYFANKIVKHTKSNTVVLAKNRQMLASGVGQTSRVDSLKQALLKASGFGFDVKGAVMTSDAFFPFPDCVEIAADAGITAVLQPGGSINDKLSIEKADEKGIAMVTTGVRHFKH